MLQKWKVSVLRPKLKGPSQDRSTEVPFLPPFCPENTVAEQREDHKSTDLSETAVSCLFLKGENSLLIVMVFVGMGWKKLLLDLSHKV